MEDIDNSKINGGVDSENALKRDEKGRLVKGTPPGPGRPKGNISIKDTFRKMFEEKPEVFNEFISGLMEKDKALIWQMLEGKPQQDLNIDAEIKMPTPILNVPRDNSNTENNEPHKED